MVSASIHLLAFGAPCAVPCCHHERCTWLRVSMHAQVWVRELAAALMDMGNKPNYPAQASVEELVLAGVSDSLCCNVPIMAARLHPAHNERSLTLLSSRKRCPLCLHTFLRVLRGSPCSARFLCRSLQWRHLQELLWETVVRGIMQEATLLLSLSLLAGCKS